MPYSFKKLLDFLTRAIRFRFAEEKPWDEICGEPSPFSFHMFFFISIHPLFLFLRHLGII